MIWYDMIWYCIIEKETIQVTPSCGLCANFSLCFVQEEEVKAQAERKPIKAPVCAAVPLACGWTGGHLSNQKILVVYTPKTNIDTQNYGLEKGTTLKYGHFWYVS